MAQTIELQIGVNFVADDQRIVLDTGMTNICQFAGRKAFAQRIVRVAQQQRTGAGQRLVQCRDIGIAVALDIGLERQLNAWQPPMAGGITQRRIVWGLHNHPRTRFDQ